LLGDGGEGRGEEVGWVDGGWGVGRVRVDK